MQLLVERVTVADDGIDVQLRLGGLASVVAELQGLERRAA